jgi:pimeloyl-ACP methyl ester carboxylesterase
VRFDIIDEEGIMFVEKRFNTGVVEINYAEGRLSGPPLVMVPGLPGRWQEFIPILPALSIRWHIYALDMRGQGGSGRVLGGYLAKNYVDDLVVFLKHLDEPVVIFGASAGGMVAMEAISRAPGLVHGLVVGDSPIDVPWLLGWMTSEWFKAYFSVLRDLAGLDLPIPDLVERVAKTPIPIPGETALIPYGESPGVDAVQVLGLATTLFHLDPGVLEYHAEGRAEEFLCGFDLETILGKITCPALFIQADPKLGGMITDRSMETVQTILSTALHIKMDGFGHDLGLDTWETGPLLRVVNGFLESLLTVGNC